MGRRRDDEHRIFVRGPFSGMLSGMMLGIILGILFLIGVVAWVLLLTLVSGPSQTKILIIQLIVSIILRAANICAICFVGYDGFGRTMWLTWVAGIVFSIIGFYIAGIPMMPLAQGKTWLLKFFLELIFYIPVAAVLTVIPALIINVLMWLIMNIFGKQ